MKKKTAISILAILVVFTISALVFIRFNNDHKECSESVTHTTDKNGNDVTVRTHDCKEMFNF